MSSFSLKLVNVSKDFNRRPVFEDVNVTVSAPGSLALTGKNGSGKSTLAKIMAGMLSPTQGLVRYQQDGKPVNHEQLQGQLGFVSPYLNLYDEFTAFENLVLLSRIRSMSPVGRPDLQTLLDRVGLGDRADDEVRTFSSGMKQRLKYAFALLHKPTVLILDEPTSNLDTEGIAIVREIVVEQRKSGLLIVATNDSDEASWCEKRLRLE